MRSKPIEMNSCLVEEPEKTTWTVGVEVGPHGFKPYVSRTVERMKRLAEKPKRSFFTRKRNDDQVELQNEFRSFLQEIRDDVSSRLWYALSALASKTTDRKFEAEVFKLFGNVTNAFVSISVNFDPASVTPDLLDLLKDSVLKLSEATQEVAAYTNTIDVFPKEFMEKVAVVERLLTQIRQQFGKYFKRNEELEMAAAEAMKNR